MRLDVLVIGAGPSGASCACHAARAGLKVTLLEARRLPRPKLCSGVLTAYSEAEALRILSPAALDAVTVGRFDRTVLAGGRELRHRQLRLVDRPRFDLALVEAAARAGADVREGIRVSGLGGISPGDPLRVDATGAAALYGRAMARRERLHLGVEGFRPGDRHSAMLDFGGMPDGYWWAFPHGDGRTAVGGMTSSRALWARLPKDSLERWGGGRPRGHFLRRAWGPVARPGLLLVGEAAGALDQALGEGIRFALWTGRLAAEAALRDRPERAYGAAYARQVAPLLAMRDAATALRDRLPSERILAGPLGGTTLRHYLGAA